MQNECYQNPLLNLRLTEIETRESILEHLKDVSEGKLWRKSGHKSLQKYCEKELGYSKSETREMLSQIGEIITSEQLTSQDPEVQERIDKLKSWRKEESLKAEIPAYQLISNRTLLELAEQAPATETELFKIYGLGEKKVAKLGAEIISLLQRKN